ncbi:MAG: hypothetical protein AB1704_26030 [Pseudomonadota bacterium]|uniref:hypothetical protein n=1 Tax=Paraburkholderia sp. TaxID=1926495 RepID=UPI0010F77468
MPANTLLARNVEFGNAGDLNTNGTGWFVGFSEWTKGSSTELRHVDAGESSAGLCIKWFAHPAGDPNGEAKPLSEGRTMSILVSPASEFRLEFSTTVDFAPNELLAHTLRRQGEFVIWGLGIFHRAYGIQSASILTVRWKSP